MSGASCFVSRSNLLRGVKLAGVAVVVTLVTWVLDPGCYIKFGILHFLAACMILYGLLQKPIRKLPGGVYATLCVILWGVSVWLCDTVSTTVRWLWPLGFPYPGFVSADYYPMLPWMFVFFFGAWMGGLIFSHRFPAWFYRIRCPFLGLVGRKSLWIYLLHQPVMMGVFWVVDTLLHMLQN